MWQALCWDWGTVGTQTMALTYLKLRLVYLQVLSHLFKPLHSERVCPSLLILIVTYLLLIPIVRDRSALVFSWLACVFSFVQWNGNFLN